MALTTSVDERVTLVVKRRFPSDGWPQRVLKTKSTMRVLMWSVHAPLYNYVCICTGVSYPIPPMVFILCSGHLV